MLRGAAVAGDPFEPDLAAAAAGADDGDGDGRRSTSCSTLGLVRRTDVPRRFRFRHPLVRRAVYESAPGGWLLGAHERCARVLAERGAPAAARAHHVEFAARHGDLAAVAVLTEAGTAAILRAPASAARWFSAALRLLPDDAPAEQRVELLLARARALAAQGRLAESHADLLECIALAPAEAVGLRVQLTTTCAGVERLLGRHEEAHARLLAGLDQLPDPAAADAIALMIELAIDGLFRADPDSVCDWAARALEAARELGERPLVAAAAAILDARPRGRRQHRRGAGRLRRGVGAGRRDARRGARRPRRRRRLPVLGRDLPGPLRRRGAPRRARAAARPRRRPPAPDADPGARRGALHARQARRGRRRARRRRRGGAAGRHHAEHGLDAAQPRAAAAAGRASSRRRSTWPRRRWS